VPGQLVVDRGAGEPVGQSAELEAGLRAMVPGDTFRLDVPGWFG
jgi:hypothetical protein